MTPGDERAGGPNVLVQLSRDVVNRVAPHAIAGAEEHCTYTDPRDRENWLAGAIGAAFELEIERRLAE